MIRRFKMSGVLMAVVAMFALTASAAQANFTAGEYPATVSGSSTKDVFDAFGSTVTCTNNAFVGILPAASNKLTITPSYSNCTAFGLPATVSFTSCDYLFYTTAPKVDLTCTKAGDAVDINVYASTPHGTPICHVKVPAQAGLTGVKYTNSGSNVIISGEVTVTTTQTRTSIFCPAGTHTPSAKYTIQAGGIEVSGSSPSGDTPISAHS